MHLKRISVDRIEPDPDVQREWTFNRRIYRKIRDEWDPAKAGVIDVVPQPGRPGWYHVFVGRHRWRGGKDAGAREMRADVWPADTTLAQKIEAKLAKDRDRRRVAAVEVFLDELMAGHPIQSEIAAICDDAGYTIGKLASGKPYNRIEAVGTLQLIHKAIGPDGLRATFDFGARWYEEPKTNTGVWLFGIAYAAGQGWPARISRSGEQRLQSVIPARLIRTASGMVAEGTNWQSDRAIPRTINDELRRIAKVRRDPGDRSDLKIGH